MYPAAILHNLKLNRYHPIFYRPAPLPGDRMDYSEGLTMRYKSKGHHTEGFETLEEAEALIKENSWIDTESRFDWDGETFPADVTFFANSIYKKEEI